MSKNEILGARVANGIVKPEWIDANGHMNVAYYVLAFDLAVDALWESFGITAEYVEKSYGSTFAVETHITYQRELMQGDPFFVTAQILAYDDKRIHQFQRLYHAEQEFLAATGGMDEPACRSGETPCESVAEVDSVETCRVFG